MYSKICQFWNYFCDNHEKITNEIFSKLDNIILELHGILQSINPSLCFEFAHLEGKNKQFFLSADGIEETFQIVNHIYQYKPNFSEWDFIKYRQPASPFENYSMYLDRHNSTSKIILSEILFTLEEHESKGIIINFFIPNYQKGNISHELSSWIILDQCIGEYSAVKRIALYKAFSINNAPQNAKSIITLKSELDALKLKYVKDFWSFFSENHTDLFCQDKKSYFLDSLQNKLYLINHDLSCLILDTDDDNSGKSALELTSRGIEEAFEDIELLYKYKPKIEKWNLYKYRRPYHNFTDEFICNQDYPYSDILFYLLDSNDGKYIVMFFIPGFLENSSDEDFYNFRNMSWFILRSTLGEYYATKKLLYQCHPLEKSELYSFDNEKPKSVLHLKSELAKIIYFSYPK